MNDPRAKLAEALALLSALNATVRAQSVEPLAPSSEAPETLALLVSADGEWIGGLAHGDADVGGFAPVRWRRGSSDLERLGEFSASGVGIVVMAFDGRIFGTDRDTAGAWSSAGFHPLTDGWTILGGASHDGRFAAVRLMGEVDHGVAVFADGVIQQRLGVPEPLYTEWPEGISADGRTVLGDAARDVQTPRGRVGVAVAGVWTDGAWRTLPDGGAAYTLARGLTPDGAVIGGLTSLTFEGRSGSPALWIRGAGPMPIGPADGRSAVPMSSDGRIVRIGWSSGGSGVWTPWAGLRSDAEYLADAGVDAGAAAHLQIWSGSADGTVYAGNRTNADGSVTPVRITLRLPCPLDYATDGFVDFFDYLAYVGCFLGDCPNYRSADFNFDGFVDWTDYADFVDAFETGC